jgi:hypothetical protein
MSATGRGGARSFADFYQTPSWVVRRLFEVLHLPERPMDWIDPCAGRGALLRAVDACRPGIRWHAVELRPECEADLRAASTSLVDLRVGEDYLRTAPATYDVAIMNPPFNLAERFIVKARSEAACVIVLERLNFLASSRRRALLARDIPDVYVLPERPSFTGAGTDATDYAWLVWHKARRRKGKIFILPSTPASERRGERGLPILEAQRSLWP